MEDSQETPKKSFVIAVAADESDNAHRALDFAVNLAHSLYPHGRLVVLHATALNPEQHIPYVDQMERIYNYEAKERSEKIQTKLKSLLDACANDLDYQYRELQAGTDEREMLTKAVNDLAPDMFVVGTRGMGALKKLILGSISDHCVKNCTCPVTIVK